MSKNKVTKPLIISDLEELIRKIETFELKCGRPPKIILTTEDNVKILKEWFSAAPDCIRIEIRGAIVVTPIELMFI